MSRYLNKTLNIMITENGCYANVRPRIGLKRERENKLLLSGPHFPKNFYVMISWYTHFRSCVRTLFSFWKSTNAISTKQIGRKVRSNIEIASEHFEIIINNFPCEEFRGVFLSIKGRQFFQELKIFKTWVNIR